MVHTYSDEQIQAYFQLFQGEEELDQLNTRAQELHLISLIWNPGEDLDILLDGSQVTLPANSILPLVANQYFSITQASALVAWQFNREFYCIIDHDHEVSCAGFLFHGGRDQMYINIDPTYQKKLQALLDVFIDEFEEKDAIQGEMLRMLLKRLIILVTRLAKLQYIKTRVQTDELDLYRQFNLLLEKNYKSLHQVQDYANLLNKSPKTLSNIFGKQEGQSPLQLIQARVLLEAKRLLFYTEFTAKEIGYELGFEDPATFSRFFKKQTGQTPLQFKEVNRIPA